MYFNDKKEDTNIDSEFKDNKKISFDFSKINFKKLLLAVGIIAVIVVIILVIVSLTGNKDDYVIVLSGDERVTIGLNKTYNEPGYKAYDKNKNDVSNQVKVTNNIDTSKKGEYEVLYSIGKINKVRYVTVAEISEETFIYLKGDINALYLEVGEKYNEPGYEVFDNIDKDLKGKVKITGNVDTSKVGTYRLTYSVVNSRNVTTTTTRTVIVVEKGKKPKK